MSVTAKEIANILNISAAAVSMALNNKPGVSAETRKKVLDKAKELEYDFSKLNLSSKYTAEKGNIVFIIYKKHGAIIENPAFFSHITEGIESACNNRNYSLNICYLYESEDISKKISTLPFFNGIILLGTEMKPEDFKPFERLKTPIVVLDVYYETLKFDCVLINNIKGAYIATNYIISKCATQPGYLSSSYIIGNFKERANGFYKAVRENGFSSSRSQIIQLTPTLDGAYSDMKELLKAGEKPSRCYFADNDLIAAGAMKAFLEFGYKIPTDISIIGFDDIDICLYTEPALSTICVKKHYMGFVAANRIIEILENSTSHPLKIEVNTTLIKREST